jgi:penicillin-binding protein 1B
MARLRAVLDRLHLGWVLLGLGAIFLLFVLWLLRPFWRLSGQFAQHAEAQPSRLYAQPLELRVGGPGSAAEVIDELAALEYREAATGELEVGTYRKTAGGVAVFLRRFPTPRGTAGGQVLEVSFSGRRVARLRLGAAAVESSELEAPQLATYYGDDMRERRPVVVDELPEHLIRAVLAAEDDGFFRHGGVSPSGILRALWKNIAGGEVRQGGSTLTQQLVKNLYLTQERTVARKAQEAVLAVLLEMRYSKKAILQAYLNEIYLGKSGGANLLGVGAAARAYFGKDAGELSLGEAATLAGMIQSPGEYAPTAHPDRAVRRRNWVLDRLGALGWVPAEQAQAAKQAPLAVAPQRLGWRRAPYFADWVAQEARRRFGVAALDDNGFTLYSTLRWSDQKKAEAAVAWGIEQMEKGWQKGRPGQLQAALVSIEPRSGAVLAYVGGRSYSESQFDRASQALRQAGSAFKPVVYATAFEAGTATPATLLEDAPLTVTLARQVWTPHNDDDDYRGWVTARQAVEQSLNVPTARLALQTGLERIVEVARGLGVESPLSPVPALALGAFEVTPLELATVYATLAASGVRPPLHALRAVTDRDGVPLPGAELPRPEPALSPQTAYLLTTVLQGVVDHGTGASVRRQGVNDALAGKTGTTNGRRDSWFAGYAPTRATLVWVGYDDNSATRLSGARAAAPIWGRFMAAVRPSGGYPPFATPRGVVTAVVDPESGELATEACPRVVTEVFREGQVPSTVCHLHGGWFVHAIEQPPGVVVGVQPEPEPAPGERGFRRWLRRVFGERRAPPPPRPPPPPR